MGENGPRYLFGQTRFFILSISTVCLTFAVANSLALNFTVICMEDVVEEYNVTHPGEQHWLQSPSHTNYLFSAIAIGCLIGVIPLSHLTAHFGIGNVIFIYGMLSSASLILLPLAVNMGYAFVFICRIIQGMSTCLSFPAIGQIGSQWSTPKAAGTFISLLSTHLQLSSIFTMPLAGGLCESAWGWRSLYYIQGFISLISFIIFYFFYKDKPDTHPCVNAVELEKIQRGKHNQKTSKRFPSKNLITDPCVLGIWLSTTGVNIGFQVFLLYGPIYMNKVQGFNVKSTGFATALPFILSAIVKIVLGPVSDKLHYISERARMVLFASLSQFVMALCCAILSYTNSPLVAQIAYTAAIVFSGVNAVGTIKCASQVYRQYVHCVMAVVSLFLCLIGLIIPVVVVIIVPNNAPEEWAILFRIVAVIVVVASIPFIFVARDQPAEWTKDKVYPDSVEVTPEEKSEKIQSSSHSQVTN